MREYSDELLKENLNKPSDKSNSREILGETTVITLKGNSRKKSSGDFAKKKLR